jgi:predicted helicase
MVEAYNAELARWRRSKQRGDINAFLRVDPRVLKWIVETKQCLLRDVEATYDEGFIRPALYRPFTTTYAYVDKLFISRLYQLRRILPDEEASAENRLIVATCHSQTPFSVQATNLLPCVDVGGRPSMCFPLYRYDDGGVRPENVTDFALEHFRERYADGAITKWAIFYYVSAILHHGEYRERYGANLKRELPRIPCAGDFWRFSKAGKQLMDLHVGWESQPVYELRHVETPRRVAGLASVPDESDQGSRRDPLQSVLAH